MLLGDEPSEPEASPYVLPRYLRFARRLALLSGTAAIGIAAGVATVSTSGCIGCSGTPCPGQTIPPIKYPDASHDTDNGDTTGAPTDAFADTRDGADGMGHDASATDAADAGAVDAGGGDAGDADGAGGGPRPAPLLPRAWIA